MKRQLIYATTLIFLVAFGLSFISAAMKTSNIITTILGMSFGATILIVSDKVSKKLAGLE